MKNNSCFLFKLVKESSSIALIILLFFVFFYNSYSQTISSTCSAAKDIVINTTTPKFEISGTPGLPAVTGCSSAAIENEGWFSFVATSEYSVVTFNNTLSAAVSVYIYTGSCGSLTYLCCRNSTVSTASNVTTTGTGSGPLMFATITGTRYFIRLISTDLGGSFGIYPEGTLTVNQAIRCYPDSKAYSTGSADINGNKIDDVLTIGYTSGANGEICGYSKFNTSNVPPTNSINITGMYFVATCNSNTITGSPFYSGLAQMENPNIDPVTSTGAQIFYQCGSAGSACANNFSGTTANISSKQFKAGTSYTFALNAKAIANFNSLYSQSWWALNFQVAENSLWNFGGVKMQWDGWKSNNPPYLVITYSAPCTPVIFTTQPKNSSHFCKTGSTSFTAVASSDSPITYQWQKSSNNGISWSNIVDGGSSPVFSGSKTSTLNVSNASLSMQFKCIATSCSGSTSVMSDVANMIIGNLQAVNLGKDTTITNKNLLTLDAGAGFKSYLWNDGSTNQTLVVDGSIVGVGTFTFTVTVTDNDSCTATGTIKVIIINDADIITLSMIGNNGCIGDTLTIPVYATNFNNIGSIGIQIKYDTMSLKFIKIKNINQPIKDINLNAINGRLKLIWVDYGMEGITIGNDKLFDIIFIFKDGGSDLTFQSETQIVNNTTYQAFPVHFVNTTIKGSQTSEISGTLTYNNTAATPLKNVKLILLNKQGLAIDSTYTDKTGKYIFNKVSCGIYTIKAISNTVEGGISPLDALLINRNYLGAYNFSDELMLKAADVNNDKTIDPGDALLICRKYISLIDTFTTGKWFFENSQIEINGVNVVHNFKGICFGDDDGSYVPE